MKQTSPGKLLIIIQKHGLGLYLVSGLIVSKTGVLKKD